MGILGGLAAGAAGESNIRKCDWCSRSYDHYESNAVRSSRYCSKKCESEYENDLFDDFDDDHIPDEKPVKQRKEPERKPGPKSGGESQRRKTGPKSRTRTRSAADPVLKDPDFNLLSPVELDDKKFIDRFRLDPLILKAAYIVTKQQQGSTSLIQRKLSIGFNRAGRIIDELEDIKVLGIFDLGNGRSVLPNNLEELVLHLAEKYIESFEHQETTRKVPKKSSVAGKTGGPVQDSLWARAALAVCLDIFGRDNELSKVEIRAFLEEILKYYGIDFTHEYKDDYKHMLGKWKNSNHGEITSRVNDMIDFWAIDQRSVKLQIIRVIVNANNALKRQDSDRIDAKSRYEVYEAFGVSVDEYNAWVKAQ